MLGVAVWLMMGALVGWIASIVLRADDEQGTVFNVVLGVVGAMIGGLVFKALGLRGVAENQGLSGYSFLVALIGSVAVLGAVNGTREALR